MTWRLRVLALTAGAAATPLVFAAVHWRRATKAGAYAAILATMTVWAYFFHRSGYGGEYTIAGGVMPAALCFGAGATALIVTSLLTRPPSQETIDKFFPPADAKA